MAYCNDLEKMISKYKATHSNDLLDIIDTITLLIERYDEEHSQLNEVDPIQLLKSLMDNNSLKQKDLAELLSVKFHKVVVRQLVQYLVLKIVFSL